MPSRRIRIDAPRLDWTVVRACYGGDPSKPSGYDAGLVLWDEARHGPGWFRQNRDRVADGIVGVSPLRPVPGAFVVQDVELKHPWTGGTPGPPQTDREVVDRARRALRAPPEPDAGPTDWRSVQESASWDPPSVRYSVMVVREGGERAVVALAELYRVPGEELSPAYAGPADCREGSVDECVEVEVPRAAFRAAYRAALSPADGRPRAEGRA